MSEEKVVPLSVPQTHLTPAPGGLAPARKPRAKRTPVPAAKPAAETKPDTPPPPPPWWKFIREAPDDRAIATRFLGEAEAILEKAGTDLANYCVLWLMDTERFISDFELDHIFSALQAVNPTREKNVLLILLSPGGSIEPAYQMSKVCKAFAHERFVVAVPRQAKSAATLLAIGADEIHMGVLGHLGPIDPQLGGLPALGVAQALQSIATIAAKNPGSSDMFSRFLNLALTVEQIGYCERISESAAQYAERLLQTKLPTALPKPAKQIANELVQEYKDHGFVIDFDEARSHLGKDWIKTTTPESQVAEHLYTLFEQVNLYLNIMKSKRLFLVGGIRLDDVLVFGRPTPRRSGEATKV